MICPYCHQEHPDNTVFCPQTGNRIQNEVKIACMANPDCPIHGQYILPPNARYCPECGSELRPQPSPQPQAESENNNSATQINFDECIDELNNLYKLTN